MKQKALIDLALNSNLRFDDNDQDEKTPKKGEDGEKEEGTKEEGEQVEVEQQQKGPANHCCKKTGDNSQLRRTPVAVVKNKRLCLVVQSPQKEPDDPPRLVYTFWNWLPLPPGHLDV